MQFSEFGLKQNFPIYVSQIINRLPKHENADLVTFTEEILCGKLHFLCSMRKVRKINVKSM